MLLQFPVGDRGRCVESATIHLGTRPPKSMPGHIVRHVAMGSVETHGYSEMLRMIQEEVFTDRYEIPWRGCCGAMTRGFSGDQTGRGNFGRLANREVGLSSPGRVELSSPAMRRDRNPVGTGGVAIALRIRGSEGTAGAPGSLFLRGIAGEGRCFSLVVSVAGTSAR